MHLKFHFRFLDLQYKLNLDFLKLFSKKGYTGVSMREIATAVGIKGASIYNHFKGKQEVFEAIFEEMTKQYAQIADFMNIPINDDIEAADKAAREAVRSRLTR